MPNTPGPIKSGKSFPARTTESNSNLQGPYDHAVLLAIKLKNAVSTSCSLSSKYCYSCCSYHIRAQKRRHNVKVFLVSSKRVGCCDNSGCSKTTQLIYSFPVADSQEQSRKLQEHNSMLRRSDSIAALTRGLRGIHERVTSRPAAASQSNSSPTIAMSLFGQNISGLVPMPRSLVISTACGTAVTVSLT